MYVYVNTICICAQHISSSPITALVNNYYRHSHHINIWLVLILCTSPCMSLRRLFDEFVTFIRFFWVAWLKPSVSGPIFRFQLNFQSAMECPCHSRQPSSFVCLKLLFFIGISKYFMRLEWKLMNHTIFNNGLIEIVWNGGLLHSYNTRYAGAQQAAKLHSRGVTACVTSLDGYHTLPVWSTSFPRRACCRRAAGWARGSPPSRRRRWRRRAPIAERPRRRPRLHRRTRCLTRACNNT